jgi:hypothetical protein
MDDKPLDFGKYKGKTPNEIADHDPQYLIWAFDNTKRKVCSRDLRDACQQDVMDDEAEMLYCLHYYYDFD